MSGAAGALRSTPKAPDWTGGDVEGVITTDDAAVIRLVSAKPLAPGLEASAPPSPANIPNNHLSYAIQWFAFALIAAVIYALALRRRGQPAD
jgi:surfeit locus 1 family protein